MGGINERLDNLKREIGRIYVALPMMICRRTFCFPASKCSPKSARLRNETEPIDNGKFCLYNETTIRVDTECSFFFVRECRVVDLARGARFGQDGRIDS